MPKIARFKHEGNWQRKSKRMFNITEACSWMLDHLAEQSGLNRSGVLEIAVRRLYRKEFGQLPVNERTEAGLTGRIFNTPGNF